MASPLPFSPAVLVLLAVAVSLFTLCTTAVATVTVAKPPAADVHTNLNPMSHARRRRRRRHRPSPPCRPRRACRSVTPSPSVPLPAPESPSPTPSASPSVTLSTSPSPTGSPSPSPSPSPICAAGCTCGILGELYGEPSFDESELVKFGAGDSTSKWYAVNWPSSATGIFRNTWDPNLVSYDGSKLSLTLEKRSDQQPTLYSGAIRTHRHWYGYGCVSACMKPIKRSGVISSLFTYVGQWDGVDSSNPPKHNEIDIEFEGKDTTVVQFNYYTEVTSSQNNEKDVQLDFDASESFHVYGFRWSPGKIEWYVDGAMKHSVDNSAPVPPPTANALNIQKVMANVWAVKDNMGPYFGGVFDEATFTSASAEYQWIRYTKLDANGCCEVPTTC